MTPHADCLRRKFAIALASLGLLLVGCGPNPLPDDKLDYAGAWTGPTILLSITTDGEVSYERYEANGSSSVQGNISRFEGDDFYVWVLFDILFDVQEPPHEVDGETRMKLYDEELTKL